MSDKMMPHAERLAWNLAVCECLILGSCKPDAFNKELALYTTLAVNDFVKDHINEIDRLERLLNSANAKIVGLQGQLFAQAHNQQENYTYNIRG